MSARPTDHPSNRESVRPTVRPVLLRRTTKIVLSATTSTLFIATTKEAAVGRHHKRGGAAFGRATSFVVSFVLALNSVNIVAVTTIIVVHVGVIGYHVPRRSCFMFPRRSCNARLRARGVRGAQHWPELNCENSTQKDSFDDRQFYWFLGPSKVEKYYT